MKIMFFFTYIVVATVVFAHPSIMKRKISTLSGAERTANQIVEKEETMKTADRKFVDYSTERAFNRIDEDKNGHITAHEFARVYSTVLFDQYGLSYDQWRAFFSQALTKVDTNKNSEIELSEFRNGQFPGIIFF